MVHLFSRQKRSLNRILLAVFGETTVPGDLLRSIKTAHERFPVCMRDPYSKESVLLCGCAAHLLKRDLNLLYCTRLDRRKLAVNDGKGLVKLD